MSTPTTPADLLDLKMMPAWVSEPARTNDYADFEGEEQMPFERRSSRPPRDRDSRPRGPKSREQRERAPRQDARRADRRPPERAAREYAPLPQVNVRFLPHPAAFESVIAQIKSAPLTYSVFALARMFLDKPERYDVQLTATADSTLHQLGENGQVAVDQRTLENGAFASAKDDFYAVEVTQTEPLKGNFSNVARERSSGTLLGPTNHHSYQPQLRNLYEQRFSRRMSFGDFQRQIEIVSDPAVVEQWKEQARSITTYTTKNQEPPLTFSNVADAERHFRQTHLPTLLRDANQFAISGVLSRRLQDRGLSRVVENAWAQEIRSPSQMMQELAGGLRAAGLNIFRHRRGMLFVSPVRIRNFAHQSTSVSASINAILEKLTVAQGANRKKLAEDLVAGLSEPAEIDRVKLSLASDLRWLISEGYVIEFNDGLLDLPRAKAPAAPSSSRTESKKAELPAEVAPIEQDAIGISIAQTIEPAETDSELKAEPEQTDAAL